MTPAQEALLRWLDAKANSLVDDSPDQWEFADPAVIQTIRKACSTEASKYQEVARELRAALADQVPREPTEAMMAAAEFTMQNAPFSGFYESVKRIWRAMYDAAREGK